MLGARRKKNEFSADHPHVAAGENSVRNGRQGPGAPADPLPSERVATNGSTSDRLFAFVNSILGGARDTPTNDALSAKDETLERRTLKTPEPVPTENLTITCVDELASAIGATKMSRIVMVGSTEALCENGTMLARRIAGRGVSIIVADFTQGGNAVRQMGAMTFAADVAEIAASPTSFAHSINRDRRSLAHWMAASLPTVYEKTAAAPDIAIILDALAEAYACTIAFFDAQSALDFRGLIDRDTALVVPVLPGHEEATADVIEELRSSGVEDVILMTANDVGAFTKAA